MTYKHPLLISDYCFHILTFPAHVKVYLKLRKVKDTLVCEITVPTGTFCGGGGWEGAYHADYFNWLSSYYLSIPIILI